MKLIFAILLLGLLAPLACAGPDFSNLGIQYDGSSNQTIASANEKLIDGTTSIGAAFSFPGPVIH